MKHKLIKILPALLALIALGGLGTREARAYCWETWGGWDCALQSCSWAYTCAGYDQTLTRDHDISLDPQDSQVEELKYCEPEPDKESDATSKLNGGNSQCTSDPISLQTGQFLYQSEALEFPGADFDLKTFLSYSSGSEFNGAYGFGWMLNYHLRLKRLQSGNVALVSGGRTTEYTFNGSSYGPPPGRFETLVKNPDNTWTITLPRGEKYYFDADGKLVTIKDRNNNTITLTYDPAGKQLYYGVSAYDQNPSIPIPRGMDYRLTAVTDTTGRTINFDYDGSGKLTSINDGVRQVIFNYDSATGNLVSVTRPATAQFPSGVTKTYVYDGAHNVTKVRDAKEQFFVENIYDTQGRVQEQILGGDSLLRDYSVVNQTIETDRNGNVTTYVFDGEGNMLSREIFTKGLRAGEPASFLTTYAYNADKLITSTTLPRQNGVVYVYDETNPSRLSQGNLLQVRRKADMQAADDDSADIVLNMTWEPQFNQIKTLADAKGEVTTTTYDYELDPGDPDYGTGGNPVMVELPEVTGLGVASAQFSYNSSGQVTQKIDANGNVTQYSYFPLSGYLQTVTRDPGGVNAVTQFAYDPFGNIASITDAEGRASSFVYNELNWLLESTDALGYKTKYTRDANANVIKVERQADEAATAWQATENTYDILNNLKTAKDPLNRVTTYNYDAGENLASVKDAADHTTSYEYDERGLLFTVTDAKGGVIQYDYDLNGNLARLTDAKAQETNYIYDLLDRLQSTLYADLSGSQNQYDKNSNLIQFTTPGGKVIEYDYDELNRLLAKRFLQTPALNTAYAYDIGSRMIDADNAAAQIHYDYDALDRVLAETQTVGGTAYALGYQYDKTGIRKRLTYPSGKVVDYHYDADTRLDTVDVNTALFADFDYDTLSRRTQKSLIGATLPLTAYAYDTANQLTALANKLVNTIPVSQYGYPLYDLAGNRRQMDRVLLTNPAETTNYNYNNIYELTQSHNVTTSQSHTYDYDAVGNRDVADGVLYTPNSLNQYTDVNSVAFAYDGNGNLTSDGDRTLTYDEENRLSSAVFGLQSSVYAYDALSRRVSKTVDGATIYFIYDDDSVVAEYDDIGLLSEYVLSDNIDEVLAMEHGGVPYYYHYDGLGSVTEITDGAGALVEYYEYDPYGNVTIRDGLGAPLSSSAIGNPYYFTGRRVDFESGLYHYRARSYHPLIGRFTQRDPLGYEDSMNLYEYAINNPINFADPDGNLTIPFTNIWIPAGEGFGEDALSYWANRYTNASKWYQKVGYGILGSFSALWTRCTSDTTATVLSTGLGIGRYLARPYYQYYPAGNSGYTSPYLTRGWGWKAPYKVGNEAVRKLSLPAKRLINPNPGTAVRRIKVNPFRYIKGPGRVRPFYGQPGGGIEYKMY